MILINLTLILTTLALFPAPPAQAPVLPNGLLQSAHVTWKPTLDPTATAVVTGNTVTDWRTGTPKNVPVPANRSALGVALELCSNNAGDWVGFTGTFAYELGIGDSNGPRDTARTAGYRGIALVGLDNDPVSPTRSTLWGLHLAQSIGAQADISLLNCIVDSHSNMPIQTVDLAHPPFGNIYLEALRFLAVSNDLQHLKTSTTRVIRGHGAARWHIVGCEMVDGIDIGDGLAGATEHFFYYDGQQGDSEVIDCKIHGPKLAAIQSVGRYTDRLKINNVWQERYPFGKLLIEDCTFEDVGSSGTACINITGGGLLDVTVKNCNYHAGFATQGWLGMAIQTYTDHKAWELDDVHYPPGQGPIIGRGYSMDPQTLPISPGLAGVLPDDGYGACRSMTIIGGTWRRNGGGAPLFNLRDCKLVTIVEQAARAAPFTISGGVIMFCPNGLQEQCGKAGNGLVPAGLGPGYWQQASLVSRGPPSQWITVPVKMGASRRTVAPTELDTWWN